MNCLQVTKIKAFVQRVWFSATILKAALAEDRKAKEK